MLLYIHIPFCDSKCHYCAFNSYVDKFDLKIAYMQALKEQLIYELETKLSSQKLETIFIGGGTPSCVEANLYEDIFKVLKKYIDKNTEITTEANPNSASKSWLEKMYSLGVNRVSFGVQSFDNLKLKKLGRSHNSKSAISAIQNALCIGFNSVNCDIIYGVKDDSLDSLKKDFLMAKSLGVTHLSAYSLIIEKATKFYKKSYMKIDDEELSYEIFDYLKSLGFKQYEISNFSLNDSSKSKHNFGYWQHKEYLGVGAGAVGYNNKKRLYSIKNIEDYIKNPKFVDIENLSNDDIKVEKVLLGLRSEVGVSFDLFSEDEKTRVNFLIEEKKLKKDKNRVFNQNYLICDELSLYILN